VIAGMRNLTILGATGSIGESTLDVVGRHPERYRVFALTAHRRVDRLAQLCQRFQPRYVVVADPADEQALRRHLRELACGAEVLVGPQALEWVASASDVDAVMAAIVGAAGLRPALAAARAGKRVLLANKESLVMAGRLFMEACAASGATLLPIDSEHNAVFQCLTPTASVGGLPTVPAGVTRILLTASGGPFRRRSLQEMRDATPEQACAHPNWSMGRKISVDSATMMNKGLELIEAHYLFGLPGERLDVVVHPQSIIHSLVEYADGSMLAQLGNPDMRTPIAHALAYPERIASGVRMLDLAMQGRLDFEAPDPVRFPCLRLAHEALRAGGGAPCTLNAANEVSVQTFLDGRIGFTDIAVVNERVLQSMGSEPAPTGIDEAVVLDERSRACAQRNLKRMVA
jgi:1-deoxy-D-xylulose-5-phosphate reductoisomerase